MLFFPMIYDDEILYSVVARYHSISGNTNYKITLQDLFSSQSIIPTIGFPSLLNNLSNKFPEEVRYTANYFINKLTLLPIFIPFLPVKRREKIIFMMKNLKGNGISNLLGIQAGSLFKEHNLKYCPICAQDDINKYGDVYFHRVHQVDGILLCEKHGCILKNYSVDNVFTSRLEYIRLDIKNLDLLVEYIDNKIISEKLQKISKSVKYLLDTELYKYNSDNIHGKYLNLLNERNLLTVKGVVRQKDLSQQIKYHFGEELLNIINCNFEESNESSWIKNITRKQRRIIHPIRHILFILFLCGSMEEFFNEQEKFKPFGTGPWLCLNPTADHYMQKVVTSIEISADYRTRKPVGTFTCSCGFKYSRKGPDLFEDDKYKIGRVKEYGKVWEKKLTDLVSKRNNGLREMSRIMKCDPKTIVKYAEKLGISDLIDSSMKEIFKIDNREVINDNSVSLRDKYRNSILLAIKENSQLTRTEIRKISQKEFSWLYRNDREWLESNLPQSSTGSKINMKINKVDWAKRDIEVLDLVKKAYKRILEADKRPRITISLIGQIIKNKALLEYHLEKLPQTKEYIDKIVESIENFQIRRITRVCKELYEQSENMQKWKIVRKAGLRPEYVQKLEMQINKIINETHQNH